MTESPRDANADDATMSFDFEAHGKTAVDAYVKVRPIYEALANTVRDIVRASLSDSIINSVDARAKDVDSFRKKSVKPFEDDPNRPRYPSPIDNITDLAGIRVITFFLSTLDEVDRIIHREFEVTEKSNKSELLEQEEKLGYKSVHYLVRLNGQRASLSEYRAYSGLTAEIQVRTILQHAWAEIEHDIKYKATVSLPLSVKRRFIALAGVFEIADREFQSIHDEDVKHRNETNASVSRGQLEGVEITPEALKVYLDKRLGPDLRMAQWSYKYFSDHLLRSLGFTSLEQVEKCIQGMDDDLICRITQGTRLGQMGRFEEMLMAGMGEVYVERHPWNRQKKSWAPEFIESARVKIERLRANGIDVGHYDPLTDVTAVKEGDPGRA